MIARVIAPGSVWGLGAIVLAQATAAAPRHPEGDKQIAFATSRLYCMWFWGRKCEEVESKHIRLFLSVLIRHSRRSNRL